MQGLIELICKVVHLLKWDVAISFLYQATSNYISESCMGSFLLLCKTIVLNVKGNIGENYRPQFNFRRNANLGPIAKLALKKLLKLKLWKLAKL